MTDSPDELMGRLSAADPVGADSLPRSNDPTPQSLLETIMSTDDPPMLDLPDVPGVDRYRPRRNRGVLLAAIAAVVALVAGFVILSPGNTEPALATVQSAARTTAEYDSGRVTTTFTIDGEDGDQVEHDLDGTVDLVFDGDDVAITGDVAGSFTEGGLDGGPGDFPSSAEARLVDGVFYASDGTTWYSLEAVGFLGESVVDYVDPRNVLTEVEELLDATEIGTETIDGVETTRYQSIVDLGDESLRESGWLGTEGPDVDLDGELIVDFYVDDDGVLRRLTASGDAVGTDGTDSGSATFEMVTTFTELGVDQDIEAPDDAMAIDEGIEISPGG